MNDQPSGNPRWEPTNGRGVPALPAPARDVGPVPGPTRSVASWLGWCPTRWRAASSTDQPAWETRQDSGL